MKNVSHITVRRAVLYLLITLLLGSRVVTQSLYLSPGQNAISLSTSVSSNQRVSGIHGTSSFSMNGLLDVGIGVGHSSIAEKVHNYDVSAFDIRPYLIFCVYKSNGKNFPISLAVGLSYDHYDYLNPVLDVQKNILFVGNYYAFDVMGYGNISLSEKTYLQPMVSYGYMSGNTELVYSTGKILSTNYHTSVVGTAVDFIIQPDEDYLYHIRPSLTFTRETPTFGLTAGIVFISVE